MSASSKKKPSAASGKLTEKQLAEQKQNKEVKMYTIAFTAVMAVVLVIAIAAGCMQVISNSGVRERKTIAYTVGDHQLNSAEFNYFYTDAVNNFINQYGAYASMFGLDTTKPLDQQIFNEEEGTTWADDFVNSAKETAKSVYVLADQAKAASHVLNAEELKLVDDTLMNMDQAAKLNGMGNAKSYLKAIYGNGATEESYRAYLETSILAESYRRAYAESLTYDEAALRKQEEGKFDEYSSFSYNQYYLPASLFLEGGKTDEEGSKTYSDAEKAASVKACEAAAKALTDGKIKTVQDLDKAIADLDINKENTSAASTHNDHVDYRGLSAETAKWLAEKDRKAGDKTYIANKTAVKDQEETVSGYTVLMFESRDDNQEKLPNVRHILVAFEGGSADENGVMTYSDEEKAAAKAEADALLEKFSAGEKTEDAFAALARENTDDPGSKENGGLYENVVRGQMVPAFNDWIFDADRKEGDTDVIETEYGYHVMYHCGDGELSYRDSLIRSELLNADLETWFQGLMDAAAVADGDLSMVRTDLVLSR